MKRNLYWFLGGIYAFGVVSILVLGSLFGGWDHALSVHEVFELTGAALAWPIEVLRVIVGILNGDRP